MHHEGGFSQILSCRTFELILSFLLSYVTCCCALCQICFCAAPSSIDYHPALSHPRRI
jgi:hypothetical protein